MKKYNIVVLIKTKMEATDCSKKAIDVVHPQIHLFGNDRGTLQAVLEHALKKKNKKKLTLKNLIDTFKIYGIFSGGWRPVIRRWKF